MASVFLLRKNEEKSKIIMIFLGFEILLFRGREFACLLFFIKTSFCIIKCAPIQQNVSFVGKMDFSKCKL